MPKLQLDDIQLYYESSGAGDPLLLIHGLGSSARDWQYQVEYFSPKYHVVAVDVRGHGQSDKPPGPYSIKQFAADTARLIEALGIAPCHVAGISMGGMIAFQLAVDRPELLRSMVIINSGPELVLRTFKEKLNGLQRLLIVRLLGMRKMGEVLGERMLPKPEHAELRRLFVEHWAENDPRAYMSAMRALMGWSVVEHLKDIRIPTLVIASDLDYTPVSAKRAYVDQMSDAALVVVEDARHALTFEHPEKVNQLLEAFIGIH